MLTQTHAVTGLAVWTSGDLAIRIMGSHHHYAMTIAGAVLAYGAARAPDVDNPDSKPGQQLNSIIPGMSNAINAVFGHRGATHWITAGVFNGISIGIVAALIYQPLWILGLAVAIGWTTHIIGDCCTYAGAPAFGPFSTRRVRLPYGYRIECGGDTEMEIIYPVARVTVLATIALSLAYVLFH